MHDSDQDDIITEKSKSQLKREAHTLLELGRELTLLSTDELDQLPIPEPLLDAILTAKKINQHGGRKRQIQYIGKLMRQLDIEPLEEAMAQRQLKLKRETQRFHQIEQLRDGLIQGNDALFDDIMERYPSIDRQHLRQLIRNAQKESPPAKASRNLFRYLRDLESE